jgi:hypothetical protein
VEKFLGFVTLRHSVEVLLRDNKLKPNLVRGTGTQRHPLHQLEITGSRD